MKKKRKSRTLTRVYPDAKLTNAFSKALQDTPVPPWNSGNPQNVHMRSVIKTTMIAVKINRKLVNEFIKKLHDQTPLQAFKLFVERYESILMGDVQ